MTGYVPEPMGFLDALDQAGAIIVADDYAAVGRRTVASQGQASNGEDPLERLANRYRAYPPCPTRSHDTPVRVAYLTELARQTEVRGVIFHEVKFCEPELFEVPMLREAFEKIGLPVLLLETELEKEVSAQTSTRIEAFIEIIRGKSTAGKVA